MLSFLNPLFLLSLPLAALPIIINLIRPRIKLRFDWPSLYLLRRAEKKRARRRIRFIEIILIALRVLLIVFAVLLLSRPYVSSGDGYGQRDIVIVLDDSLSMTYEDAGEIRFSRATASVSALLDNLNDSHRVALITAGESYDAKWSNVNDIRRKLAATSAGSQGRLDVGISSALEFCAESEGSGVHVFTDCQRNGFDNWVTGIDRNTDVVIHDVRKEAGPFRNLAITGYEISGVYPGAAVVSVSSFGDAAPARMEWEGGFVSVGRGKLDFVKAPLKPTGSMIVSLTDDSFLFDNSLKLPAFETKPVDYYISPDVGGSYYGTAFGSLGGQPSSALPSPPPGIVVSHFGAAPEGAQSFVESGGLLLLSVARGDSGEKWGLKVVPGLRKASSGPLCFSVPLHDSRKVTGPSVSKLWKAEYDDKWSVAAETACGEPAILYRELGEGEVWVVLVPTGSGSEFPLHPSFVGFVGDLMGRAREITSDYPRYLEVDTTESEVGFLSEEDFKEELPEFTYVTGVTRIKAGRSFDLTLPITVLLLLALIIEPILAAYVTRKKR